MDEFKILIVDDDYDICVTLKDIFIELGSSVAVAYNGLDAKQKADEIDLNIALIDIKLPDSDGITLMRELRIKNPDMICIIITGNASLQNTIQALKEGADSYFIKPVNIRELIKEMSNLIEKQHLKLKLRHFNQKLEQQVKIKTKELNKALNQEKLYKNELLKSSQFKSDFMASMSHELRTPLNSVIGFTDVILEGICGDINEQQNEYLNNVKSSGFILLDLINDILDIAKIESGKKEIKIEDVNLSQLIYQIKTMIKPMYEKKNLKFEVQKFEKDKIIQVDRLRLKEILFNLLSNAVKYTQEGYIKLEFSEFEDEWKFDVIDTGIGIKEKDFNLIFQDFQRVKSDYVASIQGSGLGLSLAKRKVEFLGGNISFTSIFGKGSTFSITLPKKYILI